MIEEPERARLVQSFLGWCKVNSTIAKQEIIERYHLKYDPSGPWTHEHTDQVLSFCETLTNEQITEQIELVKDLTYEAEDKLRTRDKRRKERAT